MSAFLDNIIGVALGYYEIAKAQEKEMSKDFKNRAKQARQKYYDAAKFPRKLKKKVRKEALYEYNFYVALSKTNYFS